MLSIRRSIAVLIVGLALGGLLIFEVMTPIRQRIAYRYVDRGEAYLVSQDFDIAAEQYEKALAYDPGNKDAKQELELARLGPVDIAKLHDFYEEQGVTTVIDKLGQAQKEYADPKEALQVGVNFYAAHDYAYARYPMEKAVQLDPGYPEAWNYLGLTYDELAKWDASYKAKATEAYKKRDTLTPNYLIPTPSPSPAAQ